MKSKIDGRTKRFDEDVIREERARQVRNWHKFFYKKIYLPLTKSLR